jgi:hypothetical protein
LLVGHYPIGRWLDALWVITGLVVPVALGCGVAIWAGKARTDAQRRRETERTARIEATHRRVAWIPADSDGVQQVVVDAPG